MHILVYDPRNTISKIETPHTLVFVKTCEEGIAQFSNASFEGVISDFTSFEQEETSWHNFLKDKSIPQAFLLAQGKEAPFEPSPNQYLLDGSKKDYLPLVLSLMEEDSQPSGDTEMDELFQEYRKTIFQKIDTIQELVEGVNQHPSKETLEPLKQAVHKLAGNSGSYGYTNVTDLCRQWETRLKEILEGPLTTDTLPTPHEYEELISSIILGFIKHHETPQPEEAPPAKEPVESHELDLFVADDDKDLLNLVEKGAKKKGLSIEVVSNFEAAQKRLADPAVQPRHLICDLHFEGVERSGFDLIKTFKEHHPSSSTVIGILSAAGDIERRQEATGLGVDIYFQKPIDINSFLAHFTQSTILAQKKYRVLMIDDDTNLCNLIASGLKGSPYDVHTMHDSKGLMQELETNTPDLMLIDLHLEGESGLDILHTIRSDYRFRNLPVVILSIETSLEAVKTALLEGAIDYIVKPVTPLELIEFLNQVLKKIAYRTTFYERDAAHGLYTKEALEQQFNSLVIQFPRLIVTTIQIHVLTSAPRDLFHKVSELLKTYFGAKDILGTWNRSIFAIVISDFNLLQSKILFSNFIENIQKDEMFKTTGASLCFALTEYPNDAEGLAPLIEQGLGLIEQAPSEQREWKIFSKELEHGYVIPDLSNKQAQLICHDKTIRDILEYTLELRGMRVEKHSDGKGGCAWLKTHFPKITPDIIILDGDLLTEEPFVVLEQLKNLVGNRVPILMVASQRKEKDISEALQRGASSYLVKPFSLTSFIQNLERVFQ